MVRAKLIIMTAIIAAMLAGVLTYVANIMKIGDTYTRYCIVLISVFIAILITFRKITEKD